MSSLKFCTFKVENIRKGLELRLLHIGTLFQYIEGHTNVSGASCMIIISLSRESIPSCLISTKSTRFDKVKSSTPRHLRVFIFEEETMFNTSVSYQVLNL